MTVKKSTAILCAALALVVLAVIFRFSSQPKNISREKSNIIADVVESIDQNIENENQEHNLDTANDISIIKADSEINKNVNLSEYTPEMREEKSKPAINFNKLVRKGAHIAEYAVFAICFSLFFVLLDKTNITCFIVIAVGFAYALFDEAHQFFIPGRTPKYKDILFDAAGLVIGTALTYFTAAALKARIRRKNAENDF